MIKETATHPKLADFNKELLTKSSLEEMFSLVSKYAKDIIGADRCTVFMYNNDKSQLCSAIADKMEKVIIPSNKGIAGYAARTSEAIIVNKPYSNPDFLPDIDVLSGYRTKNIAATPIFDSQKNIFGVLQLLNKSDDFNNEDIELMAYFTQAIGNFLE